MSPTEAGAERTPLLVRQAHDDLRSDPAGARSRATPFTPPRGASAPGSSGSPGAHHPTQPASATTPLLKRGERDVRVGRRSGSKEARGDVMKGGGGDAVLSTQNDGSVVVPPARRTFRVAAEGAAPFAAMLAVLVVAVFGTAAYKHHRGKAWTDRQTTVLEMVTQRTFDKQRGASQQCETCAVVLPTEAYAGRKMGRRIDEADCVVRFNDHHPTAASAQDVGSKDDVRVVSSSRVDRASGALWADPCVQGGCRRIFVASTSTPGEGTLKFLEAHPDAELLASLVDALGIHSEASRDRLDKTLRDFGEKMRKVLDAQGGGNRERWSDRRATREQASDAFFAVNVLKDWRMCGSVEIFGMDETEETEADERGSRDSRLEHVFYKTAIQAKLPGWDTVTWVPMDQNATTAPVSTPSQAKP